MITTPDPPPEPPEIDPGTVARGLAELELHIAQHVPAVPEPAPEPEPVFDPSEGETKRVARLRAEVAEAHLLAELQDDDAPLLLDTAKVRKRRRAAHEAARLHALSQDPTMRAWRASRTRRLVIAVALVALTLALGWSTAGVQAFAADGALPWSPGWIFAWFVEPFMSLALLVIVVSRTYMATLGQPIESRTLVRIEWLFLGLTLGMNAFPYLPGVADEFRFPRLVFHVLGPIVAVAIVRGLPIILAAFHRLDVGLSSRGATGRRYRANTPGESGGESGATDPDDIEIKAARVRALIAAGELPEGAGVEKIRRALGCATKTARDVRNRLAEGGGWNPAIDEEYR
jgi:hypothetical protein